MFFFSTKSCRFVLAPVWETMICENIPLPPARISTVCFIPMHWTHQTVWVPHTSSNTWSLHQKPKAGFLSQPQTRHEKSFTTFFGPLYVPMISSHQIFPLIIIWIIPLNICTCIYIYINSIFPLYNANSSHEIFPSNIPCIYILLYTYINIPITMIINMGPCRSVWKYCSPKSSG